MEHAEEIKTRLLIKRGIHLYESIIDYDKTEIDDIINFDKAEILYRLGILYWLLYALHPLSKNKKNAMRALKYQEEAAELGHSGGKAFLESYYLKFPEINIIN